MKKVALLLLLSSILSNHSLASVSGKQYRSDRPSMLLSEVYQRLTETEKGALVSQVARIGEAALGRYFQPTLEQLRKIVKQDPALLDRAVVIPLAAVRSLQEIEFARSTLNPLDKNPIPYEPTGEEGATVLIGSGSCQVPTFDPREGELRAGSSVYIASEPFLKDTSSCYRENSIALAHLVNQISNTASGFSVTRWLAMREDPKSRQRVSSFRDLLVAIRKMGYEIHIHSGREFANFFDLWFKTSGKYHSVRVALQFEMKINERFHLVPAEHGEMNFVVTKAGKRVAGLRWFFGIPTKEHPKLNAYWRPDIYSRTPWSGFVVENLISMNRGNEQTIENWLQSAAFSMRGMRGVQNRFESAFDAYGVIYVCIDSLVLGMAKFQSLQGSRAERPTMAFPYLRLSHAHHPGVSKRVNLDSLFAKYADFKFEGDTEAYQSDEELYSKSTIKMKERLLDAFPERAYDRLEYFPELRVTLRSLQ